VARNLVVNWLKQRGRRVAATGGSDLHSMLDALPTADEQETVEFDRELRRALFQRAGHRCSADLSARPLGRRDNVRYNPHIDGCVGPRRLIMPRFTQGELEIMRILWDQGELKPAEIHAQFPRKITNPSLRSYLAILLDKGHVVRCRVGKAYYYRAKTRRESTFRAMLRDLARVCCNGSVENLLCQLIRTEKLSEADLLELKRLSEDNRHPLNSGGEEEQ
jgi:BlaI family transcriptional regulator, penicillinase repressor